MGSREAECQKEATKPIRAMINNTFFVQGPTQEREKKSQALFIHVKMTLQNSIKIEPILLQPKIPFGRTISVKIGPKFSL